MSRKNIKKREKNKYRINQKKRREEMKKKKSMKPSKKCFRFGNGLECLGGENCRYVHKKATRWDTCFKFWYNGVCPLGENCKFNHVENDSRGKVGNVLCFYFGNNGKCRDGDSCIYEHRIATKEDICPRKFGKCNFGDNCKFLHREPKKRNERNDTSKNKFLNKNYNNRNRRNNSSKNKFLNKKRNEGSNSSDNEVDEATTVHGFKHEHKFKRISRRGLEMVVRTTKKCETCGKIVTEIRKKKGFVKNCEHEWEEQQDGRVHNKGDGKGKYQNFLCIRCGKFQRRFLKKKKNRKEI